MNMFLNFDSFGIFNDFTRAENTEAEKDDPNVCKNYLDIGDKIYNLVREKNIASFKEKPIFEIGFRGYQNAAYKIGYLEKRIAEKFIRSLDKERIDLLIQQLGECISINLVPTEEDEAIGLQRNYGPTKQPYICHMEGMDSFYVIDGLPIKYQWGTLRKSKKHVVGLEYLLSEFLMYQEVNKYLTENSLDNILIERLQNQSMFLREKSWYTNDIFGKYTSLLKDEFLQHNQTIIFNNNRFIDSGLSRLQPKHFLPIVIVSLHKLPEFSLFHNLNYLNMIGELFYQVVEEYLVDKQSNDYIKKLSSSCATAWQTKKNIPEKVLSAMEKSRFNDYFGYVEFDKDVDLDKVVQIEEEFIALKDFFRQNCLQDYSLRFRYLGKHKALGLYFPTIQCLCVDLTSPSSFSHEYFHLLDFKYGKLSRRYDFEPIRKAYEQEIKKSLQERGSLDSMKSSSKKYNLSYYLEPTEIFARCGELYLVHKGVNNSLASPDKTIGFAYPEEEKFLCMVEEYFDKLLPTLYEY